MWALPFPHAGAHPVKTAGRAMPDLQPTGTHPDPAVSSVSQPAETNFTPQISVVMCLFAGIYLSQVNSKKIGPKSDNAGFESAPTRPALQRQKARKHGHLKQIVTAHCTCI